MDINKLYDNFENNYLFLYLIIIFALIFTIGWINSITCS